MCLGASAKLLGGLNVGRCGCVAADAVLARGLLLCVANMAVSLPARVLI